MNADTHDLAHLLADRACIADIETNCIAQRPDEQGRRWYDTRPMLDPREMPDHLIDMNRQALDYARARGLVSAHPQLPHLVRIAKDVA